MLSLVVVFFFFKQKTAYELRISDWSSDVCSSDLVPDFSLGRPRRPGGSGAGSGAAARRAAAGRARFRPCLDRIVVRWNRGAVPSDHDPIYFKRVEQIHRVGGSPPAIPPDPDLL